MGYPKALLHIFHFHTKKSSSQLLPIIRADGKTALDSLCTGNKTLQPRKPDFISAQLSEKVKP